jgi:hypothetical protein
MWRSWTDGCAIEEQPLKRDGKGESLKWERKEASAQLHWNNSLESDAPWPFGKGEPMQSSARFTGSGFQILLRCIT